MCGVAAAIGRGSEEQARKMAHSMRHRGVRTSYGVSESWAMSHVRLPIVGVGEEHDQPVQRGPWTIAFVGEVLDFRDRRPDIECDVDLVADTWAESGPAGFTNFDGFWAVVAADSRDGSVHCLVDYLSQKPLYVRHDEHALAVASEPDAVAALGPTQWDWTYLSACAKWGYCPETWRTPYQGVRRMRPGEYAVLGRQSHPVEWSVTDEIRPVSSSDPTADLRAAVSTAVRLRVTSSDVPVAGLVSGGLDSAITYTLARRYGDVKAYHVENGEAAACRLVAPLAVQLTFQNVTVQDALGVMQEPVDLGSLLPQVALARAVRGTGGETVCLTGDGADELFGGYSRSLRYDSQASDVWHELVAWHLPRLDRVMMREQVEVRSPFLARNVVRLALGLQRELRTNKAVLREAFRDVLPAGVADVQKRALRTSAVATDREANSIHLVNLFTRR